MLTASAAHSAADQLATELSPRIGWEDGARPR
jgi:hypothetical protein